MFKVKVQERIQSYAKEQCEKHNFGMRHAANGSKEEQITGVIGQAIIQDLLGLPLIDGSSGCDDGVDLNINGLTVDVKTMGRTTEVRPYYVNNFIGLQLGFSTRVLVFCSFHKVKKELTVCGWFPKEYLKEKADFFPKGTTRYQSSGDSFIAKADLYEIKMGDLFDVSSIEDLKAQLNAFQNDPQSVRASISGEKDLYAEMAEIALKMDFEKKANASQFRR